MESALSSFKALEAASPQPATQHALFSAFNPSSLNPYASFSEKFSLTPQNNNTFFFSMYTFL